MRRRTEGTPRYSRAVIVAGDPKRSRRSVPRRTWVAALLLLATAACTSPARAPARGAEPSRLDWWREARFGIFVHWGLYSILAGEWQGRTDYGEWIRDSARIPRAEYDRLLSRWDPRAFSADDLVRRCRDAGAGYVVLTTKHHDGFCLFDSAVEDFDVGSTAGGRDVVREFATACRRHGLRVGFYHSIMDWHADDYLPRRGWEVDRPTAGAVFDRYVGHLHAQVTELLSGYGPVDLMWFDGEWERGWTTERGRDLYALCRRLQPEILVNDRVARNRGGDRRGDDADGGGRDGAVGDYATPEQHVPEGDLVDRDWETCLTTSTHWGYNAHDRQWKTPRDLVRTLVDVVSRGGNLLLNVGPRADGSLPPEAESLLAAIGRWMQRHGASIRGGRRSPFGALPFGRCTWSPTPTGATLFLHVFELPAAGRLELNGLGNAIRAVRLLGGAALPWRFADDALQVELPRDGLDPICPVVAVDIAGEPLVLRAPEIVAASDTFVDRLEVECRAQAPLSVRLTLDGSEPAAGTPVQALPLVLTATTVVKARAFLRGRPIAATVERRFERVAPWPAIDAPAGGSEPGLVCERYDGDFDRLPAFDALSARDTQVLSVPGIADDPEREFTARRFRGRLRVATTGMHRFSLRADDGAALWIDGRLVVDHDGLHGPTALVGQAPLAAGLHDVEVRWFNKAGGATLALRWGSAGGPMRPVAPHDFCH